MIKIETVLEPDSKTQKTLSEGIQSFNDLTLGKEIAREPDQRFVILARLDGEIVGGLQVFGFQRIFTILMT